MTRELFQRELAALQQSVIAMGAMTRKAVSDAMSALQAADDDLARSVIDGDMAINRVRFEIEGDAMVVVASQQPMASDLRILTGVLYVLTDLERIADHAEGIARISLMLGAEPPPRQLSLIPTMADRVIDMFDRALHSYVQRDGDLARLVCEADVEVDDLKDRVYDEAIRAMIADAASIQRNTYLLWCSHNLERIADRTTNICERVLYVETGRMEELRGSHLRRPVE